MLVRHAGCGGAYRMHHALFAVHADMRLQTEEPLVAFPGLVHLGIALPGRVLGRAGCMDDGRVHDRARGDADGCQRSQSWKNKQSALAIEDLGTKRYEVETGASLQKVVFFLNE